MADAHKNFAYSTVLTAPSPASSGTSLVVQSGDGTKFPAVSFNATVWPAGAQPLTTNAEIVRVTAISTDTFTITRTQESTSARSIIVGDQIAQTITVATLEQYIPLIPTTDNSTDIGSSSKEFHDLYMGDAIQFNNSGHVINNTATRLDLGFNSDTGAGFEIYRYNDGSRAGEFRVVYGGAIAQGNVFFYQYDGTNFNSVVTLNGSGRLGIVAGAATNSTNAKIGGTIFDHLVDAGNVTTGETDLYSDSIPASTLSADGDKITAEYGGIFVAHATATRDIKCYFGGTVVLDTGALSTATAESWDIKVTLIREGSTVVRSVASVVSSTSVGGAAFNDVVFTRITGLTLSNANTLKITGTAAGVGAATNDIVAKLGMVQWKPNA